MPLRFFLPPLERLVVLSLKKALLEVEDPKLKAEVASLVAQEAIHGLAFHQYNKQFLQHFPLPQKNNMRLFRLVAGIFNKFSDTFHYALSAAGEHFTAIAADLFLRDAKWFAGVSPEHSSIWRWHCIEEIEHKCVAFDVFQSRKGSYFIRVSGMFVMTCVFLSLYLKPIWGMMKQDNKHKDFQFYKRAFIYYWGNEGLFRTLLKPYFAYFKPNFHPSHHQNLHLIEQWKTFFKTASKEEILTGLQSIVPPLY